MPARKTIAAAAAERTRSRQRNVLMVIGAVPIVVLVLLGGLFAYRHFTALGPDELPTSISGGDRKDIQQTIQAFYNGVNDYNPQTASETMLPLTEVGKTNMDRLILEVAALQSESLTFQIQSLGSTALDPEAKQVTVRVVTNYGPRDFIVTRRDGQWRVVRAPDVTAPQEAGPVKLSWEVTNTYRSDDGNTLYVVGNIKNTGNAPGYMLTVGGYIDNAAGDVLQTNRPPLPASPFLDPGAESPFLLTFGLPVGTEADASRVHVVPDFREVPVGSAAAYKKQISVEPARLVSQPGLKGYTVRNQENKDYGVNVYGYFRDAAGKLLAVALVGGGPVAAGADHSGQFDRDTLLAPKKLPASVTGIATVDLVVVQTSN